MVVVGLQTRSNADFFNTIGTEWTLRVSGPDP